jgi:hypothetical protein
MLPLGQMDFSMADWAGQLTMLQGARLSGIGII